MGRNPKRASGVKALQAIRENGQATRAKVSDPTSLPRDGGHNFGGLWC